MSTEKRNEKVIKLNFGDQHYMALQYHLEDACKENNDTITKISPDPPIAIFSRSYYKDIQHLSKEKKHDFCFIGSILSAKEHREWVITFAKQYFTNKSIFINTDFSPNWVPLGEFDLTNLDNLPKLSDPQRDCFILLGWRI